MLGGGFETSSARMERLILMTVRTPVEDVDRLMECIVKVYPLPMGGNFDNNAFQAAAGIERYRPLEGAATGAEANVRKRPGVVDVSFELPDDPALLERLIETIFQAHSYQEPVIRLQEVLVCRSRGLDDRGNPNRWWNRSGDWKQKDS